MCMYSSYASSSETRYFHYGAGRHGYEEKRKLKMPPYSRAPAAHTMALLMPYFAGLSLALSTLVLDAATFSFIFLSFQ